MKRFTDKFINNNLFVYDTFADCIILAEKMEKSAPPERYFDIGARPDDLNIYTDTYWVDRQANLLIDFAYTYEESWEVNQDYWYELLYDHLEGHNLERREYELKRRIYPREKFKRLLKAYYEE